MFRVSEPYDGSRIYRKIISVTGWKMYLIGCLLTDYYCRSVSMNNEHIPGSRETVYIRGRPRERGSTNPSTT